MSDRFDAVVVGAGINGLVAAAELAGAGWEVALSTSTTGSGASSPPTS